MIERLASGLLDSLSSSALGISDAYTSEAFVKDEKWRERACAWFPKCILQRDSTLMTGMS